MTDPKITSSSADYDRNTASQRKCMETSIEMTPELMDELTKDIRVALTEIGRPDLAERYKARPSPTATSAPGS